FSATEPSPGWAFGCPDKKLDLRVVFQWPRRVRQTAIVNIDQLGSPKLARVSQDTAPPDSRPFHSGNIDCDPTARLGNFNRLLIALQPANAASKAGGLYFDLISHPECATKQGPRHN